MPATWVSRIGELLEAKSRQERRDVTVEELADFVGVSRQTVHTWKHYRGVNTLSAEKTAKLCEFFGVQEWELWKLSEVDEMGQTVAVAAV